MNRAERRRQRKTENATKDAKSVQSRRPFSEQRTPTIQQALDLAVQHLTTGQLTQAESLYQQILQIDPNQPVALHLLGLITHQVGKADVAVDLIAKALVIQPDYAEAHNNLGGVLRELGRLDEAVTHCKKAINIYPDYAEAHSNLGVALGELGKMEEAVTSYRKALDLKPDYPDAHYNLGNTLHDLGKLEEALKIFESIDTPMCRARVLECLFALGRYDTFYEKQNISERMYAKNIRAAAISTFASHQLSRSDPNPFCPTPLDFVQVHENLDGVDDTDGFLRDLVAELKSREAIWEPPGKTTKGGFQTHNNLFDKPSGHLAQLDRTLKDKIKKYHREFAAEDCGFITLFPKQLNLSGWFVRLLKGGHQTEHIHPSGWLSGVFYLQVPDFSNQEEGSIEFGLWGYNYPKLNKSYPKKRVYPKNGNIILFPSSLFHRTIRFHSSEERLSIAFDLIPT